MSNESFNSQFLQYKAISEAPKSLPLHLLDKPNKLNEWIIAERENEYRAQDSRGNIYLIKNPLTWENRVTPDFPNGTFIRPTPKLLKTSTFHKGKFKPDKPTDNKFNDEEVII